jgi:hypothetical protein
MIKYAFLLEEKYKKPLADKPKRNAKAFQKSMGKIVKTILESQEKTEHGNLVNVMLNKDLKLCSARFEDNDFIYNIVVKEFPGPSNRFFMKILKEIYQARKQSGMNKQNFGKKQRAFEIELKKVIKKFNESEIQYKYFMKKIQIEEEQKRSKMLELQNKLKEQENVRMQSVQQEPDQPKLNLPRKTRIISGIEGLQNLQVPPDMNGPRKTVVESEINDMLPKNNGDFKGQEEVVTIQTGNQSTEEEREKEKQVGAHLSPSEDYNKEGLIVDQIDHLDKQTLGVDSGSHYVVRKTRMLEQQTLSKLAHMQILPEENSESEGSILESKIQESESKGPSYFNTEEDDDKIKVNIHSETEKDYEVTNIKNFSSGESGTLPLDPSNGKSFLKDTPSEQTNHTTQKNDSARMTKQFFNDLPELNQSTVITIDLKDSEFLDKELYDFADYVDEDGDGIDDRKSNLEKKCFGFVWWNNEKTTSDNLTLNLRKNPYFRSLLLIIFIIALIVLFGLIIAMSLNKKTPVQTETTSNQNSKRVEEAHMNLFRALEFD